MSEEGVNRLRKLVAWIVSMLPLVLVAALVLVGLYGVWRLTDDQPVEYVSDEEHFKYGSTGGERGWTLQLGFGIPYWIWIALPELDPELLGGAEPGSGYSSIGFIYEEGRNPRFDLPVGTQMRRVQGIDRVYVNCAFCHAGSVRSAPDAAPMTVAGMPSNTLDLGAFTGFLAGVARSRHYRDRVIMGKIKELELAREEWLGELEERGEPYDRYLPAAWGPIDSLLMRWVGMMAMRDQLMVLMSRLEFIDFPTGGPGRVDTWNSPKALLGFDMYGDKPDPAELSGNVDFPSVWHQRYRRGMNLHWTGNQCSTDERNLSAGFGTGATPATLDRDKLVRIADWLWYDAEPPAFPAEHVDQGGLERGEQLYYRYCWECHGNRSTPFREPGDGGRVGEVEPIEAIRTDRGHLDSYTAELATNQNTLYTGFPKVGEEACREYREAICDPTRSDEEFEAIRAEFFEDCYPARFSHFRKTFGYANAPLDGLWLRAPYLHNGSVPNLRYLLEPAEKRPSDFYTGYDVYDFDDVGFVTKPLCGENEDPDWCVEPGSAEYHVPAGEGWRYRTAERGNGNYGHEGPEYGTELPPEDKQALLEYLKTF